MGVYDDFKDTAVELITEFGEPCTIRLKTKGTNPDPTKPHQGAADVDEDYPNTNVVFLPDTYDARQTKIHLKNREIATGSTLAYIGDFPQEIDTKTLVIRGSRVYRVNTVEQYKPNGESTTLWVLRLS